MANLHDDAFRGKLTLDRLKTYLASSPSAINSVGGKNSLTPLAAACWNGHLDVVNLLLDNPIHLADPDVPSRYGRTPLHIVTTHARIRRMEIVRALIDAGADVDARDEDDFTPLMYAVAEVRDKDVVRELVDRGASLSQQNKHNQTARTLAREAGLEDELRTREERSSSRAEIINLLVALVVFILAYVNSGLVEDVIKGTVQQLYGITGTKGTKGQDQEIKPAFDETLKDINDIREERKKMKDLEVNGGSRGDQKLVDGKDIDEKNSLITPISPDSPASVASIIPDVSKPEPVTVEEFSSAVNQYAHETNLEKFFAPGDPFLEELAKSAAALRNDPTTLLGSPKNIKRLIALSLYQPVIYCDDSGSMHKGNRWSDQRELVNRVARISTKIVPDNLGVELRFINSKASSNLTAADVDAAVTAVRPSGGTAIGTVLRRTILEPLVYEVISDPNRKLSRPLLICTITDGCPSGEPQTMLKDVIVECKRRLVDAGYEPHSVMFSISQLGDDKKATNFLNDLRHEHEIRDVLYCTTDRLDSKFQELASNEKRLEEWLLKLLTKPIMDAGAE
ncbi:uncharacterized protein LAESUDRAFT_258401 [Laetiporus sulphureus 93-53]|uniref:Uncharacterized protein n=1 Tax=Laetiporus sulphureus 93-53 TaxID=1314785 RepID=A0A165H3Y4_9APHY|nr:uncharacterized protein LAESUDRAFT_258401 [Laetiporus sulphureus 93-53]KZT11209.1 hypothetical protein LAESUDRAFT_258401 [Laetiporus sulphureus 93-53]